MATVGLLKPALLGDTWLLLLSKDMPLSVDDIYSDLGDANPSNLMLMKIELTITSSWIQDGYGSSFVDCAAGSAKQGNATVTE